MQPKEDKVEEKDGKIVAHEDAMRKLEIACEVLDRSSKSRDVTAGEMEWIKENLILANVHLGHLRDPFVPPSAHPDLAKRLKVCESQTKKYTELCTRLRELREEFDETEICSKCGEHGVEEGKEVCVECTKTILELCASDEEP